MFTLHIRNQTAYCIFLTWSYHPQHTATTCMYIYSVMIPCLLQVTVARPNQLSQ